MHKPARYRVTAAAMAAVLLMGGLFGSFPTAVRADTTDDRAADRTRPVAAVTLQGAAGRPEGTGARAADSHEGRMDCLVWDDEAGTVTWEATVPESGDYKVGLRYFPLTGSGENIELQLCFDNETEEAERTYTFRRAWADEGGGTFAEDADGNQLRPGVYEQPVWLFQDFADVETAYFHLEKGRHTVTLRAVREPLVIGELLIYNDAPLPTYEQVRRGYPAAATSGIYIPLEAETPALKSDPMLYAAADRSSPATLPSDPVKVRLNSIGGANWKYTGQWIEYTFTVPASGLYEIGMRYKQDAIRGLFTSRTITIDGAVPFAEMSAVRFSYAKGWIREELGGEEPYLFYLEEGEHRLRLTVTLGAMEAPLNRVTDILTALNAAYRRIIMVTGTNPDPLHDYNLDQEIDGLMDDFRDASAALREQAAALEAITGQTGSDTAMLLEVASELDSFRRKPATIQDRLTNFRDNLSALGAWVLRIQEQPLLLDRLYVKSPDTAPPAEGEGLWNKIVYELRALFGSFTADYASVSGGAEGREALRVWIGTGRDQATALKGLIDSGFTKQEGIPVRLDLVQSSLVQAVLAADPPDVVLSVGRGEPVNLALRDALLPLDGFDGFDKVQARFAQGEDIPYQFEGHTYAVPETRNFFMLFYRKDIFAQLGIAPPDTWEDFYRIIPIIERSHMQIGMPYTSMDANSLVGAGMGSQNIFTSFLYQRGGRYYNDTHTGTALETSEALEAFRDWTQLYTKYGFPLYYDFYNRFRTGEMPMGIQLYTTYNLLSMGAPEIRNMWAMLPLPGTARADGTIDRTSGSTGTCSIVLKTARDPEAAWRFLQWWSSADVQARYGKELEILLGSAGRYNPANVEAFESLAWTEAEKQPIRQQWQAVVQVPEIAGGYYLSRNLDNAFKTVVLSGGNYREELHRWNQETDIEIRRKRQEFHLDD